jgi:hypothetical protein
MEPGNHFWHENCIRSAELLDKDAEKIRHHIK